MSGFGCQVSGKAAAGEAAMAGSTGRRIPCLNFGLLEHRRECDSLFHNSLFIVTPPFSKHLEIESNSRMGCSKIARTRALRALFQKSTPFQKKAVPQFRVRGQDAGKELRAHLWGSDHSAQRVRAGSRGDSRQQLVFVSRNGRHFATGDLKNGHRFWCLWMRGVAKWRPLCDMGR